MKAAERNQLEAIDARVAAAEGEDLGKRLTTLEALYAKLAHAVVRLERELGELKGPR
ncbi:MAG TPA: hypothetical protein VH040_16845 [Usitatibacter sp.]|jgi:hypothetical protein|nr:hypothetical protein [Usitatibacter sp.]